MESHTFRLGKTYIYRYSPYCYERQCGDQKSWVSALQALLELIRTRAYTFLYSISLHLSRIIKPESPYLPMLNKIPFKKIYPFRKGEIRYITKEHYHFWNVSVNCNLTVSCSNLAYVHHQRYHKAINYILAGILSKIKSFTKYPLYSRYKIKSWYSHEI